jgi:D-alanyl-D-alanine carboxypeptidase (penicillin-binding protein 5/6)
MRVTKNDIKLLLIFVLAGFLVGPRLFAKQFIEPKAQLALTNSSTSEYTKKQQQLSFYFQNIDLQAKSAYVFDMQTQTVLYAKNPDIKRPLASITKVMSAIVAEEVLQPEAIITISQEAIDTEGFSGLVLNEEWKAEDLLAFSLILSSNDGVTALASAVGQKILQQQVSHQDSLDACVTRMNRRAQELGLQTLLFSNATGLDNPDRPGGEGSARDVARLLEYVTKKHSNIMQYTALPEMLFTTNLKRDHRAKNTNEIASMTPGIIGGKTGYTDLAGGNLAIVVDIGVQKPLIIVVLGSTKDARFSDVKALLNAARAAVGSQ